MALETAQYISQLVPSNPLSTDTVAQADDHIRLIKSTLKATFPNITGPVTATQDQLANPIPSGGIIMWAGALVPTGWKLCDGNNATPDLRGRFIIGSNTSYPLGSSGGSINSSSGGSHSHSMSSAGSHIHGGSVGLTALSISQLPAHTHTYEALSGTSVHPTGSGSTEARGTVTTNTSGSVGAGEGHSHTITSDGGHTHGINTVGEHTHTVTPPYYALAFIMKI